MHQALYRKYRPRSFDDVCGQDHITSVLRHEAQNSLFSHAYLFCGPRGTGKTTCAKILAKVLNCENPENGNPCGKCFSCRSIDEGNATDVLEMDAASNTGVDYIRDIKNEVSFAPAALKKRVYIIDEVHMLSIGAFNALLKTLEEPPEHAVFILATTEFHKLPATIVSRCQRFDFRRIKTDVIASRLLHIAKTESIALEENAAKIIAKQSLGGMRDAISMLELCAAGGCDVTAERVSDILGLTGIEILYKSAVAAARNDVSTIFSIIKNVDSSSKDISVYWAELTSFWRDMLVYNYLPEAERSSYLDYTDPELRLLADASRRFSPEALTYHFTLLDEAMKNISRLPQTKRLTAELTLIKMSDASLGQSNAALLSRISALEEKVSLLESGAAVQGEKTAETAGKRDFTAEAGISESPDEEGSKPQKNAKEPEDKLELRPISDISDVVERFGAKNPQSRGFLEESNCFISPAGDKLVVRVPNRFSANMLSSDAVKQSLLSAFIMCRLCGSGASLSVEVGEVVKKRPPIDELEEL